MRNAIIRLVGLVLLPVLIILGEMAGRYPLLWVLGAVGYFVAAHFIARAAGLGGLSNLGLQRHPGWRRGLLIGFALGSAFQIIRVIALWRLGALEVDRTLSLSHLTSWEPLVIALYIGFAEEIMARGYFFGIVSDRINLPMIVLLSAGWFTILHVNEWARPAARWAELFLLGTALAFAYGVTRSLWPAAGIHWGIDFWHQFMRADGTPNGTAYWLVTHRTAAFAAVWPSVDIVMSALLLLLVMLLRRHLPTNMMAAEWSAGNKLDGQAPRAEP